MVRALLLIGLLFSGLFSQAFAQSATQLPSLTIICWHDVRDNLLENFAAEPDMTAIDTRDLVAQLELLRGLGYTPIRLQQWLDAREGRASLPAKPVLLTFDDGYASLHDKVLPVLRLFNYPAVAAIVSDWITDDAAPAGKYMNQSQLRAVRASGLFELASHSHDLHQGVQANPQGNVQPAANVRAWRYGEYESDAQYQARVGADLAMSARQLELLTGERPRVMVWPYGAYNASAVKAAQAQGFSVAMGLESGLNHGHASPLQLRRILVETTMGLTDFARSLVAFADSSAASPAAEGLGTVRALRFSLDSMAAADPVAQEQQLSALLDHVRSSGVNVVYLNALQAGGAALFPAQNLPLAADLLNRVSWQLRTRTQVKVFAVLNLSESACRDAACVRHLAADLGRQVPLAGVAIEGAEYLSASQISEVFAAVRHYHPELMTAVLLPVDQSARALAFQDRVDFIVTVSEHGPDRAWASLPPGKVIAQLPTGNAHTAALAQLHREGFRHLMLSHTNETTIRPLPASVRQIMSTATRHEPRN